MYLLLEIWLASFFLRYSFLLDNQLFNFLIKKRVCQSNWGQFFNPLKLILIPPWISVWLKIWPQRFTYGKKRVYDRQLFWKPFLPLKWMVLPFQVPPLSSSKKTGGPVSSSNRKKWESMRDKEQGKCLCSQEKSLLSLHQDPESELEFWLSTLRRPLPEKTLPFFAHIQHLTKSKEDAQNSVVWAEWDSNKMYGNPHSGKHKNPTEVHQYAHKAVRGNYCLFGKNNIVSSYADFCYPRRWKCIFTHTCPLLSLLTGNNSCVLHLLGMPT